MPSQNRFFIGTETKERNESTFPTQVKTVVLALDGDDGGKEASSRLANQLVQSGLRVRVCLLGPNTWGKDWNERWQRLGQQSLAPVFEALSETHSA